ncbi:hypothetical protein EDB81DRAFT_796401 [Dactylonectria macrodidyma]|uniref:Uncharacterized protein n=1 Tax=Dactylonectria macrodidyma TaxID=307937 RepID=A0A9P9J6P0_9HYPO|nr:hypothetical protein EDB81DRAFT_796401 [Dactylonectria macrodidyma]
MNSTTTSTPHIVICLSEHAVFATVLLAFTIISVVFCAVFICIAINMEDEPNDHCDIIDIESLSDGFETQSLIRHDSICSMPTAPASPQLSYYDGADREGEQQTPNCGRQWSMMPNVSGRYVDDDLEMREGETFGEFAARLGMTSVGGDGTVGNKNNWAHFL